MRILWALLASFVWRSTLSVEAAGNAAGGLRSSSLPTAPARDGFDYLRPPDSPGTARFETWPYEGKKKHQKQWLADYQAHLRALHPNRAVEQALNANPRTAIPPLQHGHLSEAVDREHYMARHYEYQRHVLGIPRYRKLRLRKLQLWEEHARAKQLFLWQSITREERELARAEQTPAGERLLATNQTIDGHRVKIEILKARLRQLDEEFTEIGKETRANIGFWSKTTFEARVTKAMIASAAIAAPHAAVAAVGVSGTSLGTSLKNKTQQGSPSNNQTGNPIPKLTEQI